MWIVAVGWLYVAVMMSMAEATSPQGTVLGAVITFVFYGLVPVAIIVYVMSAPIRRKARLAREAQASAHMAQMPMATASQAASPFSPLSSQQADAGGLPAGDAIAPERKEP